MKTGDIVLKLIMVLIIIPFTIGMILLILSKLIKELSLLFMFRPNSLRNIFNESFFDVES